MELVVSHELVGEKCLISNNSLWNTVVLLNGEKLPESLALPNW